MMNGMTALNDSELISLNGGAERVMTKPTPEMIKHREEFWKWVDEHPEEVAQDCIDAAITVNRATGIGFLAEKIVNFFWDLF